MLEKIPFISLFRGLGAALVVVITASSLGIPMLSEEISENVTLMLLSIFGLVIYYIYETLIYKLIISRMHDWVRKIVGRKNHRMILKEKGASHFESIRVWGVHIKPHLKDQYRGLKIQGSIIHVLYMIFFGLLVYVLASATVPVWVIGVAFVVLLSAIIMDVDYESTEAKFFEELPESVKNSIKFKS